MTAPVSLLPAQTGSTFPAPSIIGLSDDEQRLVTGLSTKLSFQSVSMLIADQYYNGTQRLQNLGISIPAQLQNIRTVVDWPRICVDPLVLRQVVDGFRIPGAPTSALGDELWDFWQANNLDAEFPLCALDSLVFGRGYMIVGTPDDPGDAPLITVESPLNMAMMWDPRTRSPRSAYQAYEVDGIYCAALYLPDVTIMMSRDEAGGWGVDSRDQHNLGEVPVVRFANRTRSADREGRSEITPAVMNTTDSVVRTLLGMEIAREFYSVPHRWAMGVAEDGFVDKDGNPKTAIEMTMSKMLAFPRDENGNLPTVGSFAPADPSVFTKIVDEHAQLMSSYTGFPPDYFGLVSKSNPASADAIRVAYDGMNRRAKSVQLQNSDPLEDVKRIAWRIANNGRPVPAEMLKLETEWVDVETFTPGAMSDAMFKQAQMGAVPPSSDVVLKKLGWSHSDREQLDIDRKLDQATQLFAEVANSLQTKQLTGRGVSKVIDPNQGNDQPQPSQ